MNKPISKIKMFFWLISGSEISILEKCTTDHNRHMNIGLAIFATTLIAFLTGCLAGYKFGSQNITSALMFGVIWSLLVFTIDRNMVGTLQKNPKDSKSKLIYAIIYRAFLSLLIAFFIAIPLELWIFKEEIAKQMKSDNSNEILNQRNIEEDIYNIEALNIEAQRYSLEQSKVDSLLNSQEPPAGYKNYAYNKNKLISAKSIYETKRGEYNKILNLRKEYYIKVPEYFDSTLNKVVKEKNSYYYNKWYELWLRTNNYSSETKELNNYKLEYDNLEKKVSAIQEEYFDKKSEEKERFDSLYLCKTSELVLKTDSVQVKTIEHQQFVYSQNGFIKQWIALNNVSEFWVVFFIWFIRIVFFVIEMLPTLTKVLTPMGSYDIKLYYKTKEVETNAEYEMELLNELQKKKLEMTVESLSKIEELRLNHELKLQEEILNNLSEKQNNIANAIMDEWEKQQKENAATDLSDFVNNNKN